MFPCFRQQRQHVWPLWRNWTWKKSIRTKSSQYHAFELSPWNCFRQKMPPPKVAKRRETETPLFFFCNDDVSRLQDELPEPEPHECRATSQLVCWVHVFENSLKNMFFWALQALKIYKSIKILSFFSQNLCPFWCLPLVSNRYCPPLNCLELTCRFGSILSRWLKESCPQPP